MGAGSDSRRASRPRVAVHDFADRSLGEFAKAISYGLYDVANDEGWVSLGDVADTAELGVASIRGWWDTVGRVRFPNATKLLITADTGGSNGYRVLAWKWHLARLAAQTGLEVSIATRDHRDLSAHVLSLEGHSRADGADDLDPHYDVRALPLQPP